LDLLPAIFRPQCMVMVRTVMIRVMAQVSVNRVRVRVTSGSVNRVRIRLGDGK